MTLTDSKIIQTMGVIAGLCVLLDVILICANIIGRVSGHPIFGTYEMVGWITAIATGFGVAYTQAHKGHVAIDNLIEKLPAAWQTVSSVVVYLLACITFGLATWKLVEYGFSAHQSGSSSVSLHFHFYPIVYGLAVSMLGMTLILLVQLYHIIRAHHAQPSPHNQ